MKRVKKLFEQHRTQVAAHPFFDWLHSSQVPVQGRFVFTPVMVDFTMGFADMNKWFLSYDKPQNDLERAIQEHTLEDRTHSRLFLENWHALALDNSLGWSASQTLWWLYQSPHTLPVRRFGWEILRLAVQFPDPLVRFAVMESIEICGDVFFHNSAQVANQLSRQTGVEYRYYGDYHRLRETGHLHTDESPFFASPLSDLQYSAAQAAVQRIFSGFVQVLDHLLLYCTQATRTAQWQRAVQQQYSAAVRPVGNVHRERLQLLQPPPGRTLHISNSQAPLLDYLTERKAGLARHPFIDSLGNATTTGAEQLARFTALWGIDIAGYPDFNELALTYTEPQNPAEASINHWAADLASHSGLYLQDWVQLDLDRTLGWSSGETIAFYFLSDLSEVHRRNLARVTRLAFENPSPLARFWLMTAFEAGGDPLFDALSPVVANAEKNGRILNYWAERHSRGSAQWGAGPHAAFAQLLRLDIDAAEQHRISDTIGSVFDNFEQQFALSHRVASEGTFLISPGSLPPTIPVAPTATVSNCSDQPSAE